MITPDPVSEVNTFLCRYNFGRVPLADEDVFELGAMTSLVAMKLVLFIEQRWSLELEPLELKRDNFRTAASICALIERSVLSRAA